jgi:hypothetical protein
MEAIHTTKNPNKSNMLNGRKTEKMTTTATIPIENLKNCTNYEIKTAPGIDGSTLGTLKHRTTAKRKFTVCLEMVDLNTTLENLIWKKLRINIIDS